MVDLAHDRPGGNHCPECKHGLGSAAWCQWCGWNKPAKSELPRCVVATTKAWNIRAFAKLRGSDPDWCLVTAKDALNAAFLNEFQPDWIFLPHWSWKVPAEIYDKWRCVVFHTAPLPKYRGGSVFQHQIMDGKTVSEICALAMVEEFDAGPVYLRREIKLLGSMGDIFEDFSVMVHGMMDKIILTDPTPVPQVGEPTVYRRRTPDQSVLPKSGNLFDFIRALDADGYPKAFIGYGNLRLEFDRARANADGSFVCRARITEQ